jgi:hypothetical protein
MVFRLVRGGACAAGLALGGCGGSGTSSTGAGAPTAASETSAFIAKADAVCAHAERVGGALRAPGNEAELMPFFARAVALAEAEVNELNALSPPAEKAAAYRIWLAGLDQALGSLKTASAAAAAHNYGEVEAIIREAGAVSQRNLARAASVGLITCAREG